MEKQQGQYKRHTFFGCALLPRRPKNRTGAMRSNCARRMVRKKKPVQVSQEFGSAYMSAKFRKQATTETFWTLSAREKRRFEKQALTVGYSKTARTRNPNRITVSEIFDHRSAVVLQLELESTAIGFPLLQNVTSLVGWPERPKDSSTMRQDQPTPKGLSQGLG